MSDQGQGERHEAHNFLVTDVAPAEGEARIAVTLTDARGGRVTLHMDEKLAATLRDLLSSRLGGAST